MFENLYTKNLFQSAINEFVYMLSKIKVIDIF